MKPGAADEIVGRFAGSRGNVQGFPGFVSMEVLKAEDADEVLVITRWRDREAFDNRVRSEKSCTPYARTVPGLTLTTVKWVFQRRSG